MRTPSTESGKYDRKIDITQNVATTQDEVGTPDEDWQKFASGVWASVRYLRSYQRFLGGQETSQRTIIVNTRFIPGVTEQMRIVFEDRIYRISGFAPDFRADRIEYTCEWVENNNAS